MSSELEVDARVRKSLDQLLTSDDRLDPAGFLGRQFDLGLAWVHHPKGWGGLGAPRALQRVVDQTCRDAGAPSAAMRNPVGHGMAAPTLLEHGTPEQKRRLRPLFTGEEIWCQLFSEPDAGSDLANLATRAVRDGDEWIITGQKVWTTMAHQARWGLLAARTDPDKPKHKGITYWMLDMASPGVEVRPLHQITGEAEFNEVYLDGVRVRDADRLGEVGAGWQVILTTLMSERTVIGGRTPRRGGGYIGEALKLWEKGADRSAALRHRLVGLWIEAEALRLTNMRAGQLRAAGNPGPEGSIGKIMAASLNQRISCLAVDLLGAEGMLYPGGYVKERPVEARLWRNAQHGFLRARANSIEGGSSEIARNIIAERVLGLPAVDREDRSLPWTVTSRGGVGR